MRRFLVALALLASIPSAFAEISGECKKSLDWAAAYEISGARWVARHSDQTQMIEDYYANVRNLRASAIDWCVELRMRQVYSWENPDLIAETLILDASDYYDELVRK